MVEARAECSGEARWEPGMGRGSVMSRNARRAGVGLEDRSSSADCWEGI